jgi:hypothetical protein
MQHVSPCLWLPLHCTTFLFHNRLNLALGFGPDTPEEEKPQESTDLQVAEHAGGLQTLS